MPRKGVNKCPECAGWGCALVDPAALLVACPKCGHTWKTRSMAAMCRARQMLNAQADALVKSQAAYNDICSREIAAFQKSRPAPCSQRATDPASKLLNEVIVTMRHARTFVASREKMNPAGVELYDELLARLDDGANAPADREPVAGDTVGRDVRCPHCGASSDSFYRSGTVSPDDRTPRSPFVARCAECDGVVTPNSAISDNERTAGK
jgi:DNA-directed RNA polymerase subunit M/transcription elongation factor TFIIS